MPPFIPSIKLRIFLELYSSITNKITYSAFFVGRDPNLPLYLSHLVQSQKESQQENFLVFIHTCYMFAEWISNYYQTSPVLQEEKKKKVLLISLIAVSDLWVWKFSLSLPAFHNLPRPLLQWWALASFL